MSLLLKNYPLFPWPLRTPSNDNEFPSYTGPVHPLPSTSVTTCRVLKYDEANITEQYYYPHANGDNNP